MPPARVHATGRFTLDSLGASYVIGPVDAPLAALALAGKPGFLAVDIETEGLGVAALRCKAVTIANACEAVVLDPRDSAQAATVRAVLEVARVLVLHNSPFDVPVLVRLGLMRVADIAKVVDTLIYCRLAEPDERTQKTLGAASARYLGTSSEDVLKKAFKALNINRAEGFRQFDLDRPIYTHGAAIDGITTARLYPLARQAARERLTTNHPFTTYGVTGAEADRLLEREQVINRLFLRRAARGIRVDLARLEEYRVEVGRQRAADALVVAAEGIRPGYAADLTAWLDARGLLPPDYPRTPKTGAPSGVAANLETLRHPLAQAFVRMKISDKIENDYLKKVTALADDDERVHATTNILGAATGRMSMADPPLQQFPAAARGIVLADVGDQLTSIDWSQIEPVVAANIAQDEKLLAGYEDGTSDVYTATAKHAGISRKAAKVTILAQMYGEGLTKLAADLHISYDEAAALKEAVFGAMPRVGKLIATLRRIGREHRVIFTLSGRIVPVPEGVYDGQRSIQTHKAVNYFVQGSAYDVLAESLVAVEAAGLGDAVYLAMHDELVVSTDAAHDVRKIMETPPERLCQMAERTPVLRTDRADLGDRWGAA